MHSILSDDGKEFNTAKRVTKMKLNVMNTKTFYLKKIARHKMRRIQSKKHKIGTYEVNKILLSCFDDERFVLDDGIYTLAYFHKNCKKQKKQTKKTF